MGNGVVDHVATQQCDAAQALLTTWQIASSTLNCCILAAGRRQWRNGAQWRPSITIALRHLHHNHEISTVTIGKPDPADRHRGHDASHRASTATHHPQSSGLGGVPALAPASRLSLVKLEMEASISASTPKLLNYDYTVLLFAPSVLISARRFLLSP